LKIIKNISITVFVFLLCLTVEAFFAGAKISNARASENNQTPEKESTAQKIDRYHGNVGRMISGSAAWADAFFGTETYTSEVNKTTIRLRLSTFLEESEDIDASLRFKLRLKLPNTKKRFRITIASDPDTIERVDDTTGDSVPKELNETGDSIAAAFEYFYLDRDNHNMKFAVGATLRDNFPVVYGSTRYRYLKQLDLWTMRFVERVKWDSGKGWDSRTEVDFERSLTENFFFRTTPSIKWEEEKNGIRYNWTNSLYQSLSNVSAVDYQFNNHFDSEKSGQLTESNVRIRYRRQVWRKWLIFEVAPQLAWYKERSFETVPGIMFRLEIFLGQFDEIRL